MLPSHLQAALRAFGTGVRSKLSSQSGHSLPLQDTPQLLEHAALSTNMTISFSILSLVPEAWTEVSPILAQFELFCLISCLVPTKHPVLCLQNSLPPLRTWPMPVPLPGIPFFLSLLGRLLRSFQIRLCFESYILCEISYITSVGLTIFICKMKKYSTPSS